MNFPNLTQEENCRFFAKDEKYMNTIEILLKFLVLLLLGIVFILAGIFGWKYPSIYWFLKETRYGGLLNTIIMIIAGICILIAAFNFLIIYI